MSATLRIARSGEESQAIRLVAACHVETGRAPDPDDRDIAISALLAGEAPGAFYLIGPPSSPVGYLSISFGHSISEGGTVAYLDELYIRPSVRRRGMATEALLALLKMLSQHGVRAVHATPPPGETSLLSRLRFTDQEIRLLTRIL
ncbi:GNAT family N-acetyltransferase [Palleronia abyssalis]|uniref:N-acetyltransferase domain-containing protein n=1 Tax=Palleronia abyssalis TaxID=1501240 RepID=A0A2R8BRI4_9RHOB|nr:GNAT family N-acetyltransferase [Palleronia abyssalis]SPJ22770.1 hypothetical protein PAA8504_00568 [Palleronia abyssalis]